MDKVDLPIFSSKMRLNEALDYLHLMNRGALVTTTRSGYPVVLDPEHLLVKGMGGNTTLGYLAETAAGTLVLPEHRHQISSATEQMLDSTGSLFGIGKIEGGIATIFTRHEDIAANFQAAIGYCQCTGPEREICSPGDYPDGKCAQGHQLVCRGI